MVKEIACPLCFEPIKVKKPKGLLNGHYDCAECKCSFTIKFDGIWGYD